MGTKEEVGDMVIALRASGVSRIDAYKITLQVFLLEFTDFLWGL